MILSPPVSGGMLWYGLVQPRLAAKPVPVQPAAAPAPRKLLSEICVSYPYCKLENCEPIGPTAVQASFPVEQAVRGDKGHSHCSTSELARHMANAGSAACALANPKPGRYFYQPVAGTFTSQLLATYSIAAIAAGGSASPGALLSQPANTVSAHVASFKRGLAVADSVAHGCHLRAEYVVKPYWYVAAHICPVSSSLSSVASWSFNSLSSSGGSYSSSFDTMDEATAGCYQATPATKLLHASSGSSGAAAALWQGARFPGHYDLGEHYAAPGVMAVASELTALVHGGDFYMLHCDFRVRRLVPAHVPCVVSVQRLACGGQQQQQQQHAGSSCALLQAWVREMPGAITYRATLREKGRVARKPAVELLYTVV
ncbi:hypothetical protein OEZ86_005763 [Tetradesmus obliquus]|nr:hypothetical protein OEZ86_005763 [Tetradesmus obliquus]